MFGLLNVRGLEIETAQVDSQSQLTKSAMSYIVFATPILRYALLQLWEQGIFRFAGKRVLP